MANTALPLRNPDRRKVGVVYADSTITLTNDATLVFAATAGAAFTATLPAAADVPAGDAIEFKKTDASANDFTVARAGADTIDGANSKVLGAQYDWLRLISDGVSKWSVAGSVLSA
ncbi:MAG: hypothetical protein J0I48_19180 [Devosia sp.]|uniref:hypothetical protein n=1 Tax=Devosia sp. 66-22 TaxID=1895753 RepID=UPI000B07A425|nr:hypothetical protein [Devosia sp. 66-22]MBN9348290.1 hypothetical protein [Devosia sp.]